MSMKSRRALHQLLDDALERVARRSGRRPCRKQARSYVHGQQPPYGQPYSAQQGYPARPPQQQRYGYAQPGGQPYYRQYGSQPQVGYPQAPKQGWEQERQAPGAESEPGSWRNPVVVQVREEPSSSFWWNLLLALLLCRLFVQFEIGSGEERPEGKASDKPSAKADGASAAAPQKRPADDSLSAGVSSLLSGYIDRDKIKPVDLNASGHNVSWDDVLGCDEAKNELMEVMHFLKNPDKFTRLGGKLPKGYLLVGPPGTGKTMLAKAIAKETKVPFFYASGSQFDEVFVGVGSKRVRELFEAARQNKPCLIFIDEIDAVGSKRSKHDASHDRATINQLLSEMDGFNSSDGIVVIAATNSPQTLDKALTRPGRLDRSVSVGPPDLKGRVQLLEHYLKKVKAGTFSATTIARGTSGMTGADLANVVNIATISAAKKGLEHVTLDCLEDAKDRVSMGLEHKNRRVPEHERQNTAFHEAGHALVAMLSPKSPPLHKATIIPRGQSLGVTVQLPADDQVSMSLAEMKDRLRVLMGGRIAEQIVFGHDEVTTGASNDLEQATKLARVMVRKYGLSSTMGCVDYSFTDDPEGIFLSNATKKKIDQAVRGIVDQAHAEALSHLTKNRDILNKIAEGLLKNDTLTGAEMRKMAGVPEPEEKTIESIILAGEQCNENSN
ncbi:ATP-dependent zinc metalloprotease FTSH 5 [Diplonema papillatum]|nr:ATP-dependent zinc metalloprotease FTSH 5 [Diplonema papillatum]